MLDALGLSKLPFFKHTSTPRSAHPAGPNTPLRIKPKGFEFLGPPMMHFGKGFRFLGHQMMHFREGFKFSDSPIMHFREGFRLLGPPMMHRRIFCEGFRVFASRAPEGSSFPAAGAKGFEFFGPWAPEGSSFWVRVPEGSFF